MASIPQQTDAPASRAFAVTPSDSTVIFTRGIYVGGDGNLTVRMVGDSSAVTMVGVVAGMVYPFSVDRVMAATTATNLVGLY